MLFPLFDRQFNHKRHNATDNTETIYGPELATLAGEARGSRLQTGLTDLVSPRMTQYEASAHDPAHETERLGTRCRRTRHQLVTTIAA